jgi:hypothetical protein
LSEKKKKIVLAAIALLLVASVLTLLVFAEIHDFAFLPNSQTPTPPMTPMLWPVLSNVELNVSQGFGSSFMVAGENSSPMVVLPPGGGGTIPFTLSSPVNVSFTVSLSMYLGSENETANGVHFNISPANFTVNPGQQVTSTLTITVDQDAPQAYYSPLIAIETNRQSSATGDPYVGGGPVAIPSLLISNYVPACLYIVNEQQIPTSNLVMNTPSPGEPATWPLFVPAPYQLPNVSTIHLSPGQTTTVFFGCFSIGSFNATGQLSVAKPDQLTMNLTTSQGMTCQFSPTPMDIVWGGTGSMYSVNVTASLSLVAGTYQVKGQASLGSHLFDWTITFAVG